jgi:hypothetical protein
LTPGRGDRRDIGFSSPPLSKGGHLALGCLRGTELGKIDRGLYRIVHEVGQQELGSQRDQLDDVGVCPPSIPDRRKLGIGNFAARLDERFREGDRSLAPGIARAALFNSISSAGILARLPAM